MSELSRQLKQLDKELLALDDDEAMVLSELDGFIAGLLVCPEMIMPGEWLPLVWGRPEDEEPCFDSLDHFNRVLGLVMAHYNRVAETLFEHPERYAPLFDEIVRPHEIVWEVWIEGFEKAIALRPQAWRAFHEADPQAARAMSGLLTLADVARQDPRFSESEIEALSATGHEFIGDWVVALNRWRLDSPAASSRPTPAAPPKPSSGKAGRNDPCPCGSGKKYKKCCGLN
jgi:uncharacterized protein